MIFFILFFFIFWFKRYIHINFYKSLFYVLLCIYMYMCECVLLFHLLVVSYFFFCLSHFRLLLDLYQSNLVFVKFIWIVAVAVWIFIILILLWWFFFQIYFIVCIVICLKVYVFSVIAIIFFCCCFVSFHLLLVEINLISHLNATQRGVAQSLCMVFLSSFYILLLKFFFLCFICSYFFFLNSICWYITVNSLWADQPWLVNQAETWPDCIPNSIHLNWHFGKCILSKYQAFLNSFYWSVVWIYSIKLGTRMFCLQSSSECSRNTSFDVQRAAHSIMCGPQLNSIIQFGSHQNVNKMAQDLGWSAESELTVLLYWC